MHGITGIDHPVIAVADMDAARATYQRLGFTVPPRGSHLEWGTGNWCIMFPGDYLELRGILDPARYTHGLEQFLQIREGLMGVAFRTDDARASERSLADAGVRVRPVRELTRNFELPEGWRQPRFALCFLEEGEAPGLLSVVLCQHLTPELIRRADWLQHANTVTRVVSMTAVVADVDAASAVHRKLFDEGTASQIRLIVQDQLAELHPGAGYESRIEPPYLAAVTLAASDLDAVRHCLRTASIPFVEPGGEVVRVAPRDTCGLILDFVPD